jgi:membrane-associated phospholipid phosphatase
VILIGGALTVLLLALVVSQTDWLRGVDHTVARWSFDHASGSEHRALTYVTDLGETWSVAIVAVVVGAVDLARRRNPWTILFLLVVIVGDKLLTQEVKGVVDRQRPPFEAVAATLGPSYPSGHSSTAASSWAAFAFVASFWVGWRRWRALATGAFAIAVAVATSRVLLDVHWLTDVLGGLALGWAWFAACALGLWRPLRPRLREAPDGRARGTTADTSG